MLKITYVPPDSLIIPRNTTTNANITIVGISDVTIFNSGFVGIVSGSRILIFSSSITDFALVFLINIGYTPPISTCSTI